MSKIPQGIKPGKFNLRKANRVLSKLNNQALAKDSQKDQQTHLNRRQKLEMFLFGSIKEMQKK
jgi:hypothetical protein